MKKNINVDTISYKNVKTLRVFINNNGRILNRRKTGLTSSKQRELSNAIKRARFMGLIPYIVR
jgi:small subunit ribosomal protein S18